MARKLTEEDYNKIRVTILDKLYAKECWTKGHMLFERLKSSMPGHLRGNVKYVLKDLMKDELFLFYGKTKHGDAYQLNIKRLKEIEEIIKQ